MLFEQPSPRRGGHPRPARTVTMMTIPHPRKFPSLPGNPRRFTFLQMDNNPDLDKVKRACEQLIEHFDTVQVFVTRHEAGQAGGTINVQFGLGNWYARSGQVHSWLVKNNEEDRETCRHQ